MPDHMPATPYAVPRWASTLAVTSAVLGLAAAGVSAVAGQGAWTAALPWLVMLGLGIPAIVLIRTRGTAFAMAVVTLLTFFAGPQLVVGALVFTDAARTSSNEWVSDVPRPAAMAVGGLSLLAGLMGVITVLAVLIRVGGATAGRVPRTPFRVEVIGALVLLACAAVAQLAGSGLDPSWLTIVLWLARYVPALVLLGLALRVPGSSSLAVVGALLLSIGLAVVGGEDVGPELLVLLGAALVLAVIVVWWNATPQPARRMDRAWDTSAPLEPWAGVALILSFVPVFFIAAVVLGHVSYERIEGRDSRFRGRIIAASAIVLAFVNLAAIVLFVTGSLSALGSLAEGLS